MAVLLFEGVNCTGKSTLAQLFAARTGLEIVKFGIAPADDPFGYFAAGIDQAALRSHHFIIDRCHLSNYAYQQEQQSGVMSIRDWSRIDQRLARLDTWLFLMTDDVFQIERRMQERKKGDGADGWNRERIARVQERFEDGFQMTDLEPKGQFSLGLFLLDGIITDQFKSILARFREACR